MTRVLITRAEPDTSAFAQRCRARGLDPIVSPVMRIDIENVAPDLSGIGALAFTSANGVRAFAANSTERSLPVFAVGAVTAEAAKGAGFHEVAAASGDVEGLATHIASESIHTGKSVLHIAGADRAGDLVSLLKAHGIAARRQTLYRATPESSLSTEAVSAIQAGGDLWVTLFSPRTARLFLELVAKAELGSSLAHIRAACLSEAVAEVAAAAPWAALAIAPEREAESVIETCLRGDMTR